MTTEEHERLTRCEAKLELQGRQIEELRAKQDDLSELTATMAAVVAKQQGTDEKIDRMGGSIDVLSGDIKALIAKTSEQGAQILAATATATDAADDIKEDQTARRKRWEKLAMEIGLKILAPIAAAIGGGIVVLMNLPS